jgi:hypothetical protein
MTSLRACAGGRGTVYSGGAVHRRRERQEQASAAHRAGRLTDRPSRWVWRRAMPESPCVPAAAHRHGRPRARRQVGRCSSTCFFSSVLSVRPCAIARLWSRTAEPRRLSRRTRYSSIARTSCRSRRAVVPADFCTRYVEEERGALGNGRCGEPAFALGAGTPLLGEGPAPPGPARSDGSRGGRACRHRGDRRGPRVPQPVYPCAGARA